MERHSLMITVAALATTMMLGAGCAKEPGAEASETVTNQASAEGTIEAPETTVKALETTEQTVKVKEACRMFQGAVTKVTEDGAVLTLQADDGRDYDISQSDTWDIEVEIDGDVQVVIAYIRESPGRPEDVALMVTPPEQRGQSILMGKSTITTDAMSSLTTKTDDGQELSFLKDSCPMREGALAGNSGDEATVTCVGSQGVNYPVEIKGTKQMNHYHDFVRDPCRISVFPVQPDTK